ncbi:MAG: hypothetical protein ACWA5X_03890 [bacterium]
MGFRSESGRTTGVDAEADVIDSPYMADIIPDNPPMQQADPASAACASINQIRHIAR